MAQTTTVIEASRKAARRASSVGQTTRVGVARASIPATASGVCVSISHRPYRARLVGMCATDNRLFRSPYPDENGEPYKTLFNNATARQPGSTPHTNATARAGERSRHTSHTAITAASGARFGLMSTAIDAARPAAIDARSDAPTTHAAAWVQNAAAGMSLIGDFAMARTVGLVATSHAAPKAMTSDPALRPNAKVAHTSRPAVSGTIQNAAQ